MTVKSVFIMLAVLCVSACDQISEAMNAEPANGGQSGQVDAAPSPKQAGSKADTKLDKPFKSFDEAMTLKLFDIGLDSSTDEVKAILLEKGFIEPRTGGLAGYEASIGYNCAFKYSGTEEGICDKIGQVQEEGYLWTRGTLDDGEPEETILPLFYVGQDKRLRLWHLEYQRAYVPDIAPSVIGEQMRERFGAPTFEDIRETYAQLSYYVQMDVPQGYTRTDTDERGPARFDSQRAVKLTRIGCLKSQIETYPAPATPECKSLLSKPAKQQFLFDGMSNSPNEVLDITVNPDRLRMKLTGYFLHRAISLALEEQKLIAELAELERRRKADGSVADDL